MNNSIAHTIKLFPWYCPNCRLKLIRQRYLCKFTNLHKIKYTRLNPHGVCLKSPEIFTILAIMQYRNDVIINFL